jgi:hypothetical protein
MVAEGLTKYRMPAVTVAATDTPRETSASKNFVRTELTFELSQLGRQLDCSSLL